ncbi:response regulator [Prevotella sp.]|uniref:response regulator n=1 Tax=Prevotella sp. TaxID=59823 RepID=UPI003FD8CE67
MNKKKILIAEDNLSNFKYLYYVLAKDYEIIHAQNGEEAIELFKEKQPDLILMDIGMPLMDGNEATKEIRKLSADIPIIGLTAYAYASDETKGLESGMNRYLTKPISITDLKKIVTEYTE